MKIVIDIPNEEYKTLSKMSENEKVNELSYYERIIANGIPLPKGHGDLIDRSKLQPKLHGTKSIIAGLEAPTVIPADKENK